MAHLDGAVHFWPQVAPGSLNPSFARDLEVPSAQVADRSKAQTATLVNLGPVLSHGIKANRIDVDSSPDSKVELEP
jgi:hypothetical protein